MKRSVGIIGTGSVGTSVAVSALHSGVADELLLHDARLEVAEGEAMDLTHGASFLPAVDIRTAAVAEMIESDVVVVAAGRGGRPGESRLDLLRDNAAIVRDIARAMSGFRGTVIMVTNPVDVLTLLMARESGLPAARVVGTGTMLDTARLRQRLSGILEADPRSIHAQVVGEHGDSEVVLWSGAEVGGVPLRDWPGWRREREETLAKELRRAAEEIIRRKGATNHAIGLVTADLLRCIVRDERRVLTISRVQEGAMGLRDVALSLPSIVGDAGAVTVLEPRMSPDEHEALERSAEVLRQAARGLTTSSRTD
jgi:L-lactate dehydrogenase